MPATMTPLASLDIADGLVASLVGHDESLKTVEGCVLYLKAHGTLRRGSISKSAADFVEQRLRNEGYEWDAPKANGKPATASVSADDQSDGTEAEHDPHTWTDWPVADMTDNETLAEFCTSNALETLGALWEYIHSATRGGTKARVIAVDAFERFFAAYPDFERIEYHVADKQPEMDAPSEPRETRVSPLVIQREKALRRIEELNSRSLEQRQNWECQKAEAAAAKKAYDLTVAELHAAISSAHSPQLQLPGMSDDAPTAAEENARLADAIANREQQDDEPEDDWRGVALESLDLPSGILKSLAEHDPPILTIGDVSELGESGKNLTDVKGIGQGKAERVSDALEAFWESRGLAKDVPPSTSEPSTDDDEPDDDEPTEPASSASESTGRTIRLTKSVPGLDCPPHGLSDRSIHHASEILENGCAVIKTAGGLTMMVASDEFEIIDPTT